MPFINAKFSATVSPEKEIEIKSALGEAISLLGKPERYLMVEIEDRHPVRYLNPVLTGRFPPALC